MSLLTKNVVVSPAGSEAEDAMNKILRAVSYITGSPASSGCIPQHYNQLEAAKDVISALKVFQDKIPGYDINIIRKAESIMSRGSAISDALKILKKFV